MIVINASVTTLPPEAKGAVLITGSHGGVIAAHMASLSGASSVIFNDAGGGLDGAGTAGLALLQGIGMAAACVSHMTARIGDGKDSAMRGIISAANMVAQGQGVRVGMRCKSAAKHLLKAPVPHSILPPYGKGRELISSTPPEIWALDSVGKVLPADAGKVLIIGSHGGLHAGEPETALAVKAAIAAFNDAGGGIDNAGFSRLTALANMGVAGVTVAHSSARIGSALSSWETGVISKTNSLARSYGAREGQKLADWIRAAVAYVSA
jgi:hypothetical protein